MNRMTLIASFAAVTASLLAAPVAMASDESISPEMKDKVTAQMVAQGYEVRKLQMEDGLIEVYAVKDGKTYEIYLDDALKVVKTSGGE
jgi:hypothetical protein